MSMKRIVSVVVMLVTLFVAVPVMAEDVYYSCSIVGVSAAATTNPNYPNGIYALTITDINGSFSSVTCWLVDPATMKPMLSILLAAIATDRNIRIFGDPFAANPADRVKEVQIWTCDYADPCQ